MIVMIMATPETKTGILEAAILGKIIPKISYLVILPVNHRMQEAI